MHQILRVFVLLVVGGGAMTAFAGAASFWLAPQRRIARILKHVLGVAPDAVVAAPVRGQGAGLTVDPPRVATLRGFDDHGLVFELSELIGAELIFDGQVAARAFRAEQRRPLDRIDPQVSRVTLRLVFDDVREPEFEMDLWTVDDPARQGWDGPDAVQAARRFFARIEAVVRR